MAVATGTAGTLRGAVPGIAPMVSFPLVIVPTFIVPILAATHVVIFRRLRSMDRAGRDR